IASPHVGDLRRMVWRKLLRNLTSSPLSVVLRESSFACLDDAPMRKIYRRMIEETLALAASAGYALPNDPDDIVNSTLNLTPSLLQDYQRNRPMEVEELLLAPLAFGKENEIDTPTLDVIVAAT